MSESLQKRIDELERKVRDLEARPIYVPVIVQPYAPVPAYPALPGYPPSWPIITC